MLFRKSLLCLSLALVVLAVVVGCSDDDNKVPVFTRTSSTLDCGIAPMEVQFVAIASGGDQLPDPTGANIYLTISWDFGDGTTGNGSVTPHTFTEPGLYDVIVTVTDDDGDHSTATIPVEVRADSLVVTTTPDTTVTAGYDFFTELSIRSSNVGSAGYDGPIVEGLVINEVVVFNDGLEFDDAVQVGSFMEILNTGTEPIDLQNYTLTTDPYVPDMHVFGDVPIVDPGEYQLVWLDGRSLNIGEPHTDFELLGTYNGEPEDWPGTELYLLTPARTLADVIILKHQQTNVPYGRTPDGLVNQGFQFSAVAEACGFDPETSSYSRFDFTWTMNDSFDSIYTSNVPMHTFNTMDVGTNTIDLLVFDSQTSVYRRKQVVVEVLAP